MFLLEERSAVAKRRRSTGNSNCIDFPHELEISAVMICEEFRCTVLIKYQLVQSATGGIQRNYVDHMTERRTYEMGVLYEMDWMVLSLLVSGTVLY
jgi:hypothetical protein